MASKRPVPPASLASPEAYPVPEGARLLFRYTLLVTDGFMRGDVSLLLPNGDGEHVIARNVPVTGTSRTAKAVGDYGKLFPEPIQVEASEEE